VSDHCAHHCNTSTLWQSSGLQHYPALSSHTTCEICIVGGGITGLASAFELNLRGRDVLIIEAGALAAGQTSRSTAHLVTALDERYFTLDANFGPKIARAAARQHTNAIKWIREIVKNDQINCDLAIRNSLLVVDPSIASRCDYLIAREFEAATRAGVECHRTTSDSVMVGGFCSPALLFPDQAQLDPVRLVHGLAAGIIRRSGRIHCDTAACAIKPHGDCIHVVVHTGHTIRAKHVLLATHRPPDPIVTMLRPLSASVSFVVAFQAPPALHERDELLLWDGYWDNSIPYHYARVAHAPKQRGSANTSADRWFIVGGEDRGIDKPCDSLDRYDAIERWTRLHLPYAGPRRAQWKGTILEPKGEFAIIDQVPTLENVYVVTGDSGNGLTYAAIAARRIADMIEGLPSNPLEDAMFAAT